MNKKEQLPLVGNKQEVPQEAVKLKTSNIEVVSQVKAVEEKEHDPKVSKFFNKDFAFQSQRRIEPEEKELRFWDSYWHLGSQNTPIFKNLDILIKENGTDQDKNDYKELKAYFRVNSEAHGKRADSALAKELKSEIDKNYDPIKYAATVRKLIYLYDKYYEPKMLAEIEKLGKKGEAPLPATVPDYLQDFYVKVFPFLTEIEQSDVYALLVKDKRDVAGKAMPSLEWKKKDEAGVWKSDQARREALFSKKQEIVTGLLNFPMDNLSKLHENEIKQLSDLLEFIIKEKNISVQQKRRQDKDYQDPQLLEYRKFQEAILQENNRRAELKKGESIEKLSDRAAKVVARFDDFDARRQEVKGLPLSEFKSLSLYIENLKKNKGRLYSMLVKPASEYPKILASLDNDRLNDIGQELSFFDNLIVEANTQLQNKNEELKAETLRDEIQDYLKKADLATSREFWLAMGENPREVSMQFAAGKLKEVPALAKQKLLKALEQKLDNKNYSELNSLNLDLSFKTMHKELGHAGILNPEKEEEWKSLGAEFAAAKSNKEKKKLRKKLEQLRLDNLTLSFRKFTAGLLEYIEDPKQQAAVAEFTKKFNEATTYEEKVNVYNEFSNLTDTWLDKEGKPFNFVAQG